MKSVEEYYYTVHTHCNILVDMYLDKHVTTPGCQFYVDLYPPPYIISSYDMYIMLYNFFKHFIHVANQL